MCKYIYVHPTFVALILISLLSGMFYSTILFTIIIIVHESGHFLTAKLLKWNVDKIYFYPYGGYTKFNEQLNRPLKEELLIMLMGPLIQFIFFLITKKYIPVNYHSLYVKYNYSILLFNLLPIYPLDGGKLFNIICACFMSYRKSLSTTLTFSYMLILLLIIMQFFHRSSMSLSLIMIISIVLLKLNEETRKKPYYCSKFMLERFLYPTKYNKIKKIDVVEQMHRDKKHIIRDQRNYISEKEALKRKFIEYKRFV